MLKQHHAGNGTADEKNSGGQLRGGVTQTAMGQGHSQNMSQTAKGGNFNFQMHRKTNSSKLPQIPTKTVEASSTQHSTGQHPKE